MVLTASTMLPLGTPLPVAVMQGGLRPVTGGTLETAALEGRPVLVLFLCPHCPTTHPQDGPEGMAAQALSCRWTFPYLQDPDQSVAQAFRAACTPDVFLFDASQRLAYRGQFDDSRPGGSACDGRDLRAAMAALLEGRPLPEPQRPAIGCNIKWRAGTEPPWFGG